MQLHSSHKFPNKNNNKSLSKYTFTPKYASGHHEINTKHITKSTRIERRLVVSDEILKPQQKSFRSSGLSEVVNTDGASTVVGAQADLEEAVATTLERRAIEEATRAWGHPDPEVPNHLKTGFGAKELGASKRRWPAACDLGMEGEGGVGWSMVASRSGGP